MKPAPSDVSFKDRATVRWVAMLVVWVLTAGLGLLDLFAIRQSVLAVYVALGLAPGTLPVVDKSLLLVLGLAWLAGILYAQHSYSQACGKGMGLAPLLVRFRKASIGELVVLAMAAAILGGLRLIA